MNLPGFTAAAAAYRGSRTYRTAVATPTQGPWLTPTADQFDQDFCADKELNANYPHPEDCGRYISCDESGRGQDMPCVAGLHFVPDETRWGHCDYPHIANCDANS